MDRQEAGAFTQQIVECLDKLDSYCWRPTFQSMPSLTSLIRNSVLGKRPGGVEQGEERRRECRWVSPGPQKGSEEKAVLEQMPEGHACARSSRQEPSILDSVTPECFWFHTLLCVS